MGPRRAARGSRHDGLQRLLLRGLEVARIDQGGDLRGVEALGGQQPVDLLRRHALGEQKALQFVAADRLQEAVLLGGLNPFRTDAQAKRALWPRLRRLRAR